MATVPGLIERRVVRYADIVGGLQRAFESWSSDDPRFTPAVRARWLYYNVYTVPWRTFEILDVFRKHTGRSDLAGLSALDLGAGAATMDLFLLLEGKAAMVVGVDIDGPSLGLASGAAKDLGIGGLKLVRGDLGRPPFAPERFDLALSYDSFYFPGIPKEKAIERIRLCLKPGGTLIVKVMNRACPPFAVLALPGVRRVAVRSLAKLDRKSGRRFGLVQPAAPTARGLVRMLRHSGFSDVRAYNRSTRRPTGFLRWVLPHVIVAARKP